MGWYKTYLGVGEKMGGAWGWAREREREVEWNQGKGEETEEWGEVVVPVGPGASDLEDAHVRRQPVHAFIQSAPNPVPLITVPLSAARECIHPALHHRRT